jgi:hypothetical protein
MIMRRCIYSRFASRMLARMGLEYMRMMGEFDNSDRPRIQRVDGVWCVTTLRVFTS